jgi:hypothetical protein
MLSQLQVALERAAERICSTIAKEYASDGIYGFALYTSGEYRYVIDSFSTTDGLRSVAQSYLNKKRYQDEWGSRDIAMRELKWSPCDSPYHGKFERDFKPANSLLDDYWRHVECESDDTVLESCHQVHEVLVAVLKRVRDSGIFDESVILNVLMGDQSNEERLLNAEPLNSKAAMSRFRKELEFDVRRLSKLRKSRWKA